MPDVLNFDPGDELCPPWWPRQLWDFEWFNRPGHPHVGGPVNYPPDIDDILVGLSVNVLSYRLRDQDKAAEIRALTVATITETASRLTGHPQQAQQQTHQLA